MTSIEWTRGDDGTPGMTWNPTIGCDKVSAGCTNCYAIRTAYRNAAIGQAPYQGLTKKLPDGSLNWTGVVRMLPERLALPLSWKKPRRIFLDSMSDLFHEDVTDDFIDQVFAVMALTPWHTYQVLTKRPERMRAYMTTLVQGPWAGRAFRDGEPDTDSHWRVRNAMAEMLLHCPAAVLNRASEWQHARWPEGDGFMREWPLPNVWLGTSVEDQRAADERIPLLLQTPAAVRFLSCEPLLGPLDLRTWMSRGMACDGMCDEDAPGTCQRPEHRLRRPDWIIAGAESGPNSRPMDEGWVRSLRDQCQAAPVAFFYKQNAVNGRKTHLPELDGRQWIEFPTPAREPVPA